jgi:hypothetical protein
LDFQDDAASWTAESDRIHAMLGCTKYAMAGFSDKLWVGFEI